MKLLKDESSVIAAKEPTRMEHVMASESNGVIPRCEEHGGYPGRVEARATNVRAGARRRACE